MLKLLVRLALFGALFVVLLEIIARAEDSIRYGAPFTGHYYLEGIRGVDDRGTYRCAENARYKHFELGEHGFRVTPHIDNGEATLVWLGASEAFGLYETPGEDVANQLERRFAEERRSVEVVNASCFGLNPTRMRRLLQDPIKGMQPDMIALYPTPHFYLDNHVIGPDKPRATPFRGETGFVSRLLTKSRDVVKTFLPAAVQDGLRNLQTRQAQTELSTEQMWQAPPADRLALFETHLRELLIEAKATGARVVVLTHANAFHNQAVTDQSKLQAWQKFHPRAAGRVLIEFDEVANQLTRDIASQFGIDVVDVAEWVSGDPADFADFSHFTDSGAAKVAARLEQWVAAQGY